MQFLGKSHEIFVPDLEEKIVPVRKPLAEAATDTCRRVFLREFRQTTVIDSGQQAVLEYRIDTDAVE